MARLRNASAGRFTSPPSALARLRHNSNGKETVTSPDPERAIRFDSNGVTGTYGYENPVRCGPYSGGGEAVIVVGPIASPCPERAVHPDGRGVPAAYGNRGPIGIRQRSLWDLRQPPFCQIAVGFVYFDANERSAAQERAGDGRGSAAAKGVEDDGVFVGRRQHDAL